MTRSVWRKRFKITGLLLCFMVLGLWVFSVMYVSNYTPLSSNWTIGIGVGRIGVWGSPGNNSGWTFDPFYSQWKVLAANMPWTEFARDWLGFGLPARFHVPVWLLVVATGFPTAILWWRDRPTKAGFCKACKYDLTGNVSGICPECGTSLTSEKAP